MKPDLDVAVVGAGIAGLTAAHELRRAGLAVRVYEQLPQVGGRMRSIRQGGWTVDTGAEQVPSRGYRATWELLRRLRATPADVPRVGGAVAVWRGGRAHLGVGEGTAVVTGTGLSARARLDLAVFSAWTGRRRAGFDGDRPEHSPLGAATVREVAARYHRDLHDYLFQPVAGCFFGWDTARSTAAPMVSLLLEAGSPSHWRTYRDGMDFLARRLAADTDVVTGRTVREVIDAGGHAVLRFDDGQVTARAAVLAVPAPVAAVLRSDAPADEQPFLTACWTAPWPPPPGGRCTFCSPRPSRRTCSPASSSTTPRTPAGPRPAGAWSPSWPLRAGSPSCWTPLPTRPPTSSSVRRNAMSRASVSPAVTVSCTPSATAFRKPPPRPCGNAPASCPGRCARWSTPATGSCCGPPPRAPSGRARWPRPAC